MLLEPYDASELKLRKPGEVLREIPTSYYSKRYIPLCDNLFTALRLSDSWEQYTGSTEESWEDFEESFANGIRTRMKDSFEIAKAIEEAQISKDRQKQTVCFHSFRMKAS